MARYHDFVSSLEDQNIARAGWRPQVTASGWVGKEWRSNIENVPSYNWSRPGWNLELRQLIFDAGATTNRIRQFGFEKLSKYYDLRATTNALANEAVGAYLDVQRYRTMQTLAQDNFSMHQTTLNQLRERQQSGVGRGVDMEQASGRLSLAQTNLMTESNNLNDVTQRYRRLVGEYPPAQMEPVPAAVTGLPVVGQTKNFEDALRANPTILSKQALVQAAEAGEKVAKAAFAPTVDLRASTGRDREQPGALYRDVQSSRVQLMLTYPLYRGGADSARLRQTAAQNYAAGMCVTTPAATCSKSCRLPGTTSSVCASNCPSCASTSCRHPKSEWLTSSNSALASGRCWTCWIPRTSCSMLVARC